MATRAARGAASEPTLVGDKLYMENTLLRVAGALFCHDAKRAPSHIEQIELIVAWTKRISSFGPIQVWPARTAGA